MNPPALRGESGGGRREILPAARPQGAAHRTPPESESRGSPPGSPYRPTTNKQPQPNPATSPTITLPSDRNTDGNDGSLSSGLKPSISPLSPVQSTAALVRSQHFSGVADEFAEKTRSTGITLTIGLARSIGLAIVRLGVAASLRALLVACRAGRASESIARSSRCTWPEMARDGVRWGEMVRDCGGPHDGAWAWCRHAMAWDGACVHLPRDG